MDLRNGNKRRSGWNEDVDLVVFRWWPEAVGNEVVALFPEAPFNELPTLCSSYQHIGQHGAADYDYLIRVSRQATPEEYRGLAQELTHRGYRLRPVKHNRILSLIWFRRRRAILTRLSCT